MLSVFGSLTGQIIAAFTVRREFHWKSLLPFIAGGLIGIPMGVAVMPHLDMDWFKFGLGCLLVLWCPAMLLSAHLPRPDAGRRPVARCTDAMAGLIGGAMGGLGGFSGTVPTLWCTLRGFERHVQRTVIQNFNLSVLAVTMVSYLTTGMEVQARHVAVVCRGAARRFSARDLRYPCLQGRERCPLSPDCAEPADLLGHRHAGLFRAEPVLRTVTYNSLRQG